MRSYAPFLAHQIARFGALTIPQMLEFCTGRCKKSVLYETIKGWAEDELIAKAIHPTSSVVAYLATPELYKVVYGPDHERRTGVRISELGHSLLCANVFLELSRYENVTGIASEYEVDPHEARQFCYGRVPDGIIEVTQGDLRFELAVEVEISKKNDLKMGGFFSAYRQSLLRNMACAGVVVVAANKEILARYQRKLPELPSDLENRILLVDLEGLRCLKAEYFGERTQGPGEVLTLYRNVSAGVSTYAPLKTEDFPRREAALEAPLCGAGHV